MLTNPIQVLSETELLGHKFTVYGTAENPLFLAKEVAECIDYAKRSNGVCMKREPISFHK